MTNDYTLPPGVSLNIAVYLGVHPNTVDLRRPRVLVSLHDQDDMLAMRSWNLGDESARILASLAGPGACPEGVAGWLVELSTAAEAVMLGARALSGGAS